MAGRKLRLLMVNDQEVGIGTDAIDVIKCNNGFGEELPWLAHWHQHMHLWGNGLVPEFDLLLIDIKFEQDEYDPHYFGEEEAKKNKTTIRNPFGLLHALPLAARQDLTNMPFVWGIHSGDPSSIKDDPVAIWAFGLLCAMEQREGWSGYDTSSIPSYFSEQLGSLQALPAKDAWQELIGRYRKRLKQWCELGRIYIELDSLNKLIDDFKGATASNFDSLASEALFIYAGYEEHMISLRSLFAEFDPWDQGVKKPVLEFLKDLKSISERKTDIFPQVQDILVTLENDDEISLTDALPSSKAVDRDTIGVGVLVCLWLKRFYEGRPRKAKDILEDAGYGNNHQAPKRLLIRANFKGVTFQTFLDRLEFELLPPILRECGRQYWEALDHDKRKDRRWPACLGEPV
jgi:hypothetical protein